MKESLSKQEDFLNHIAKRLGRPRRSAVTPPAWTSRPYAHLYEGKSQEDLIQQFIANLSQLDTEVDRIHREEVATVFQIIKEKWGIRSAVYWNDDFLRELEIASILESAGIIHTGWDHSLGEEKLRECASGADLGITFADMGLAETGTVVLLNGGVRGRMVSLLPPAYLCILKESSIVPRLTQAVERIHSMVPQGLPACINFITGPSRTGDIEMDLALGVHGPGKVHVILLRE